MSFQKFKIGDEVRLRSGNCFHNGEDTGTIIGWSAWNNGVRAAKIKGVGYVRTSILLPAITVEDIGDYE